MSTNSLTRRIFRIIFAIGAINVLVTMVAIEYIYEAVEDTILMLELAEERAFIEHRLDGPLEQRWSTALLDALYLPNDAPAAELPRQFRDHPVPFSGEVRIDEKSYLISIERTASGAGVLYLSQDISILEDREDFMQIAIGLLCIAMLLLVLASGSAALRPLFSGAAASGIRFWSAIYIPIVVAMAASQNVVAAVDGGLLAMVAACLAVALGYALVPLLTRLGPPATPLPPLSPSARDEAAEQ
jgi:malonate transporter MadL subunit